MLIVSKEKKKGKSRAEDLYAKYRKYRLPFSFLWDRKYGKMSMREHIDWISTTIYNQ